MTHRLTRETEYTTFSIAARCPATSALGVAVATAVPAVGSNCSHIKQGVGAIATQAWVNPYLGIDGLNLLEDGKSADEAVEVLLAADPRSELRQLGVVDAHGNAAARTGSECKPWCGQRVGHGYSIQGNMLVGPTVLQDMEEAFLATLGSDLAVRLLAALSAGDAAGGDERGRQSAAIKVFLTEEYPLVDLRVDEHVEPVAELRRVFEVAQKQLAPFVDTFPKRSNPAGSIEPGVSALLALSPDKRRGGRSDDDVTWPRARVPDRPIG